MIVTSAVIFDGLDSTETEESCRNRLNDRERPSGATGTRAFMSIGLLLQWDKESKLPHSFMDDLESMFWLLFWICVHYSGPCGSQVGSTEYAEWNFLSPGKLAGGKASAVGKEQDFLDCIKTHSTDYYAPLFRGSTDSGARFFQTVSDGLRRVCPCMIARELCWSGPFETLR
jgi:hypothetical protein